MNKIIILVGCYLLIHSCKSKPKPETDILDYVSILNNDIKEIKETPFAMYLYNLDSTNKVVDSVLLDRNNFASFANQFITPNITEKKLNHHYEKNIYQNNSTQLFDWTYTTANTKMEVQRLVVSTSKEDVSKFKNIIITKKFSKNNIEYDQQLYWESKQFCLVTTIETKEGRSKNYGQKIVFGLGSPGQE
jgi:HD superfamily phosphohydrolase